MAALPFRFTGDEALLDEAGRPVRTLSGVNRALGPELTPRALLIGCALGALLAAGNVYTGLKSGLVDGGALTAAFLSFAFFATLRRWGRGGAPFGIRENNIAQTTASSAAVMAFVCGFIAPMPALHLLGKDFSWWAFAAWGAALSVIGIGLGALWRRKLIVEEQLAFPSGSATAELIRAMHDARNSASRRTWFLILAVAASALVSWFRDGRPSVVPQAFYLPITIAGLGGASLTMGVASSPLFAATGIFIGLRASLSLVVGGVIAWVVLAPIAVTHGWATDASYSGITTWLVWPALGIMLSSTFVPLLLDARNLGRVLARVLGDARGAVVAAGTGISGRVVVTAVSTPVGSGPSSSGVPLGAPNAANDSVSAGHMTPSRRMRLGAAGALLACVLLVVTGWYAFGLNPLLTTGALVLALLLTGVCARVAGETDIAPSGPFSTLGQIMFAGGGPTRSILAGSVAFGTTASAAQALWGFKAGRLLGASPRAQIIAQALGALIGIVVVVPVFSLVIHAYPLGTETMPAAGALSWRATAEALAGGLGGLPQGGVAAGATGLAVGLALSLVARTRFAPLPAVAGGARYRHITPAVHVGRRRRWVPWVSRSPVAGSRRWATGK